MPSQYEAAEVHLEVKQRICQRELRLEAAWEIVDHRSRLDRQITYRRPADPIVDLSSKIVL